MLRKGSIQPGLFAADTRNLDFVDQDSFYGFLARQRSRLFREEDFADLYCLTTGRDTVPPSLLAVVLLLQAHDRVSDDDAVARAAFDMR